MGANQVTGDPMPDHDLHYIRGVFTNLMDAGSMDVRKRNDIAKRLDELYTKLQAGHVDTTVSQKVMQMARSLESQDYAAANKIQSELCNSAAANLEDLTRVWIRSGRGRCAEHGSDSAIARSTTLRHPAPVLNTLAHNKMSRFVFAVSVVGLQIDTCLT